MSDPWVHQEAARAAKGGQGAIKKFFADFWGYAGDKDAQKRLAYAATAAGALMAGVAALMSGAFR